MCTSVCTSVVYTILHCDRYRSTGGCEERERLAGSDCPPPSHVKIVRTSPSLRNISTMSGHSITLWSSELDIPFGMIDKHLKCSEVQIKIIQGWFLKNTIVPLIFNKNLICLKNKNISVVSKIFLIDHYYHYLFLVCPIHGNNNKSPHAIPLCPWPL